MLKSKYFDVASIASLVLAIGIVVMWVSAPGDQPITSAAVVIVSVLLALSIVLGFIGHILKRIEKRRRNSLLWYFRHCDRVETFDKEYKQYSTEENHGGNVRDFAFRANMGQRYRDSIKTRY